MWIIKKMSRSLNNNIGDYSDYDVIEMKQQILSVQKELESYDVESDDTSVAVSIGEINRWT